MGMAEEERLLHTERSLTVAEKALPLYTMTECFYKVPFLMYSTIVASFGGILFGYGEFFLYRRDSVNNLKLQFV